MAPRAGPAPCRSAGLAAARNEFYVAVCDIRAPAPRLLARSTGCPARLPHAQSWMEAAGQCGAAQRTVWQLTRKPRRL